MPAHCLRNRRRTVKALVATIKKEHHPMLTKEQVQEIAGAVLDPVLNLPLSEFKAIKNVVVDGDAVAVTVCPGYPVKSVADELASRVKTALTQAL